MSEISKQSRGELVLEFLFGAIVFALVSVILVFSLQSHAQQEHTAYGEVQSIKIL